MSGPMIEIEWVNARVLISGTNNSFNDGDLFIDEGLAIGACLNQGKRLICLVAVDWHQQAEIHLDVAEAQQLVALLQQAIEDPVAPVGLALVSSAPANDEQGGAA